MMYSSGWRLCNQFGFKHVKEKVDFIAGRRTKKNSQKWVVKKCGSQVGELDQLKLKTVVLYDYRDEEIHMT